MPLKGIHPEQIPLMASLLVEYCNFVVRSGAVDCSSSIGAAFCDTSDLNNLLRPADIIAITLEAYPKFLRSHEYNSWKDKKDSAKITTTRREEIVSRIPFENEENKKNAICRAISSVDKREIERIIQAGSILTSIIAAVETLPVCVCISTARRDRPGFPLIYVNASFEKVTGYSRNEIIGQNCRFLQGGKSEIDAIKRLTTALKNAKPVRTTITNFRKDGFPFKNLLSMKPIFDENGEYSYVIGVQFDVTQADSTPAKLKLADDVINMLPNVIVSTSNDVD